MLVTKGENSDGAPEAKVHIGPNLGNTQRAEVVEMINSNKDLFTSLLSGKTNLIFHNIVMAPGMKVEVRPYWVPEAKRAEVRSKVGCGQGIVQFVD